MILTTKATVGGMIIANTPPFFTNRFEPVARVTLYLNDVEIIRDIYAWRGVADYCVEDSCREMKIAPKIKTAKEQGVTRASDSGPLKKNAPKKRNPPIAAWV